MNKPESSGFEPQSRINCVPVTDIEQVKGVLSKTCCKTRSRSTHQNMDPDEIKVFVEIDRINNRGSSTIFKRHEYDRVKCDRRDQPCRSRLAANNITF